MPEDVTIEHDRVKVHNEQEHEGISSSPAHPLHEEEQGSRDCHQALNRSRKMAAPYQQAQVLGCAYCLLSSLMFLAKKAEEAGCACCLPSSLMFQAKTAPCQQAQVFGCSYCLLSSLMFQAKTAEEAVELAEAHTAHLAAIQLERQTAPPVKLPQMV